MTDSPPLPTPAAPTRRPRIGIPLDSENGGGYSAFPWYALRQNYCAALVAAGAVPVLLPHHPELVADYAEMLDGLLIAGGAFDIDPALFGAPERHATVTLKSDRTAFEFALVQTLLAQKKPMLGICGGQQLLNVVLGGTLIQHIPDAVANALAHEQPNPRTEPGHLVEVVENSLLHRITGQHTFPVNSAHHQAVDAVGPGVVVTATAPDGVVEAIEYPAVPFCLGVQWHPEYHISGADKDIFTAFVAACGA